MFMAQLYLMPFAGSMIQYSPFFNPSNIFTFEHTIRGGGPEFCIGNFSDPRDEIVAALNELMFRGGAHYASASPSELKPALDDGVKVVSNVTGVVTTRINVFKTDWTYFAGAAVVELLTVCAILATFWVCPAFPAMLRDSVTVVMLSRC